MKEDFITWIEKTQPLLVNHGEKVGISRIKQLYQEYQEYTKEDAWDSVDIDNFEL